MAYETFLWDEIGYPGEFKILDKASVIRTKFEGGYEHTSARNTSIPAPDPRSKITSPSFSSAAAVGLLHPRPIIASSGICLKSSAKYPIAAAWDTVLAPHEQLEQQLCRS